MRPCALPLQAGFPNEQWDALPTLSKLQILGAISLLEVFGEVRRPPPLPPG